MQRDKYTIEEKMIPVSDGHLLYVQVWGSKTAKTPIVFLHGGPGSGCSDDYKQLFDPNRDKVIFFDQRGSGRSTPAGSLVNNNTKKLITDINSITQLLGVDKFGIIGGSWGSCLALAYAIEYQEKLEFIIIRGVLTGRRSEIDFVDKGLYKTLFPDIWAQYQETVPGAFKTDPSSYHVPRILGSGLESAKKSAYAYATMENALAYRIPKKMISYEEFNPKPTIIENFYMNNLCFLPEGYIMQNAYKIKVSVCIVQGRYDVICPGSTAFEISNKLPNSKLIWTNTGHSGSEPENIEAVSKTLDEILG